MKRYKVRREIIGEFVENDTFGTIEEATAFADKAVASGIWDSIEIYEI